MVIGDTLTLMILFSCAFLFLFWYKRLDLTFKVLAISSWIYVFVCLISLYIRYNGINNWALHHLSTHVEFIFLGAAFFISFKDARLKKGVIAMGLIYLLFAILDTIYLEPLNMAPGNIQLTGNICAMLCALGLFYQIFREGKSLYIERDPLFWLGASVLTYCGASMFISLFQNYLVYDLPLWMYMFFFYVDLFLFFLSKAALLYGAYLLIRKDRTEQLSSQNIHLIKRAA